MLQLWHGVNRYYVDYVLYFQRLCDLCRIDSDYTLLNKKYKSFQLFDLCVWLFGYMIIAKEIHAYGSRQNGFSRWLYDMEASIDRPLKFKRQRKKKMITTGVQKVCSRGFHTAWTDTDRILCNSEQTEAERDQDICMCRLAVRQAPPLRSTCYKNGSSNIVKMFYRMHTWTRISFFRMIFCLGTADSLYFGNGSRELTLLQRGNSVTSRLMPLPS